MKPEDEPEMRAAQTQSLLHTVGRLPSDERSAILAAIGSSAVERVRSMLPLSFLPMELHMRISDAIRDVVGPTRNVALWRDTMVTSFQRPFLKSFVALTIGIFGVTPSGLLKRADRIYEHITRAAGVLSYTPGPAGARRGRVALEGFPAHRFRFICYVEGLQGCLEATLDICRSPGSVSVVEQRPTGDVTYEIVWS